MHVLKVTAINDKCNELLLPGTQLIQLPEEKQPNHDTCDVYVNVMAAAASFTVIRSGSTCL